MLLLPGVCSAFVDTPRENVPIVWLRIVKWPDNIVFNSIVIYFPNELLIENLKIKVVIL